MLSDTESLKKRARRARQTQVIQCSAGREILKNMHNMYLLRQRRSRGRVHLLVRVGHSRLLREEAEEGSLSKKKKRQLQVHFSPLAVAVLLALAGLLGLRMSNKLCILASV